MILINSHDRRTSTHGRRTSTIIGPLSSCLVVALLFILFANTAYINQVVVAIRPLVVRKESSPLQNPAWLGWEATTDVYVFGDSFSSSFFDIAGVQPSLANPFGNDNLFPGGARHKSA